MKLKMSTRQLNAAVHHDMKNGLVKNVASVISKNSNVVIGTSGDTVDETSPQQLTYTVAIGAGVNVKADNSVAIGQTLDVRTGASNVVFGRDLQAWGGRNIVIGYGSESRAGDGICIGRQSNCAIGGIAIGNEVITRVEHETQVPGAHIVAPPASSGQYNLTPYTLDFPLATDHEIAHVEASVSSYDSANSNKWTLNIASNYMFYNNTTATLQTSGGSITAIDPSASGDTVTVTASGTNIRLTFTAGDAAARVVKPVLRVYMGRP